MVEVIEMVEEIGARPSGTGSQATPEAPAGLRPSGFDPARVELDKARRKAAEVAIAQAQARGVGFYPGKIMAAYLEGMFDRSAAVQRALCRRCNSTGTVHGIIDDDLLISGSWPCERCARDSDRSPEGIETPKSGSTEGESAGREAASPNP